MKKPLLLTAAMLLLSVLVYAQNPVTVAGASSKRPSEEGDETTNAFDGDLGTMYHSDWSLNAMPDTIDFYFIGAKSINRIDYTPRQSGTNGIWTTVDVYYATTDAPSVFVSKQSNITWALTNTVKTIDMTASPIVKPQVVRLVIRAAGGNFSSCAEINFSSAETGTLPTATDCDNPTTEDFTPYADIKLGIASASVTPASHSGEGISRTYDNNTSTLYHSSYGGGGFPISMSYNFTGNPTVNYINYIPRQDGNSNGLFGTGEIWYTTTSVTTLTKLMDFDAGFNSSSYQIDFPSALTNVTQIVVKVLSGKNNYASCAEMQFYQKGGDLYTDVFANDLHTELKPGVTQTNIDAITSPFFKSLAQCIFNNSYNKKYRLQSYDYYPNPGTVESILKTNGLNRYENPTGIAFKANTKAIVFVGNSSGANPTLLIKDFALDNNATSDSYPLKKGFNVVDIAHDGLGYINYFSDKANLQPIQIHIATGHINGYYSPLTHTENEWVQMLLNGIYPKLDIKGSYVNLNIDKSALINNSISGGRNLVAAYDTIVYNEYILSGLVKYNRVPKNHMFAKAANDGGGYYAGGDGVHLDLGWGEAGITNAVDVMHNPWGIPHEFGHNNQVRPGAKWVGMTEVTNNIHSAWIQYKFGKDYPNATRIEKDKTPPKTGVSSIAGGRYGSLYENCLIQKKHIEAQDDVFVRLVPFWQLELYYQVAGAGKHLPSLQQRMDGMPIPAGQPDVAFWHGDVLEKMRTTSQSGLSNGQLSLNFLGAVCDAVQEDLTDFFVKGGYLLPIDLDIDDYGVQHMTVTQQQIDSLKSAILAKGYPKPVSPVLNYISANSVNTYKNLAPMVGTTMTGVTVGTGKLTIDNSKWANAVAFETYNQKALTDVAIYSTGDATTANATTTVQYAAGSTSVYAVGYDGLRILVYPATDANNAIPTARITSPTNEEALTENSSAPINTDVADDTGIITKVEFFVDNTRLGETGTAPYTFQWNTGAPGTYALTTRVTDQQGRITQSAPVSVTVEKAPLPVLLLSFTAQNNSNNEVYLKWKVANEVNFSRYEVERALDPNLFVTVGSVSRNELAAYTFIDESPLKGINYYRLKMVDLDDSFKYSPIKSVQLSPKADFTVYSNPSENGILNFKMTGLEGSSSLNLTVTTAGGRIVKNVHFDDVKNNKIYTTTLENAGIYIVRADLTNGQKFATKVVVSK